MSDDQKDKDKYEKSRRIKRIGFTVPIPSWVFVEVMKLLPEDTDVIATGFENWEHRLSSIIVRSDQFEVCPESQAVPELLIKMTIDTKKVSLVEFVRQYPKYEGEKEVSWRNQNE